MATFYTDSGSINRLEVSGSVQLTGSSLLLNVNGSGSKILVISGSSGGLMEIGDINSTDNDLYSIESSSVQLFKIDKNKNVSISGSLKVTGSFMISGSFITSPTFQIVGSGSTLFSISGSNSELFKIVDSTAFPVLTTISSGSLNVLTVTTASVVVSGSLNVSGSISGSFPTNIRIQRLELGVSSTTAITTGAKGRKTVSYNGTITGWRLVTDQNTTTTLDVWKANGSIPTVANTITGTAKPALTSAQLGGSTTLTGWTTAVSDGDVFILNVDSNNNANYLVLELEILLNNS